MSPRARYTCRSGFLYETQAGFHVAIAWGYVSAEEAAPALAAIDRLGGRVFGLCRR